MPSPFPNFSPTNSHLRIAGEDCQREGGDREMSDILPFELWTEILVRLPVRTLLTLKCVSKSFFSLIQNPVLTFLHFSRFNDCYSESNGSDLLLLERCGSFTVCRGNTSTKTLEFTISIDSGDDVVGYVNGLLWLHRFDLLPKHMLLCNPSIRKCLLIPPSPASHLGRTEVGFGCDPLSNDYKAVVIVYVGFGDYNFQFLSRTLVEVYSLKKGCWRSIGVDLVSGKWVLGKSVYANGAVHWLAGVHGGEKVSCWKIHCIYSHVISFDLGTEVFSYRELPKPDEADGGCQWILKFPLSLHGSLAVLFLSRKYISVWVMEQNSWTKEYMMESSSLYRYLTNYYNVAARINNAVLCEESGELLITANKEGVISYNFEARDYKTWHYCVTYVDRYVENLLWEELLPPSHPIARNKV